MLPLSNIQRESETARKGPKTRAKCTVTTMQSNRQPNWLRAGGPRIRENMSKTFALGKNSHRAENLVKHVQKPRSCKNLVNNDQNATDQDFATFDQNTVKTRAIRDPANQPSAGSRVDGTDSRPKPRKSRSTYTTTIQNHGKTRQPTRGAREGAEEKFPSAGPALRNTPRPRAHTASPRPLARTTEPNPISRLGGASAA